MERFGDRWRGAPTITSGGADRLPDSSESVPKQHARGIRGPDRGTREGDDQRRNWPRRRGAGGWHGPGRNPRSALEWPGSPRWASADRDLFHASRGRQPGSFAKDPLRSLTRKWRSALRTLPLRFLAALLVLASCLGPGVSTASAATPFPMSSGNYFETFNDIANWTNNFVSGVGAQYWSSVGINSTGTIPDGVKITVSTAAFVTGTAGGVQKGSGNIQLLSTNGTDNINADAIDLLLDFTGMNAGTLSYDFATVFNSTGNRNGSLRVYTSTDGTTFTELPAASVVNFTNNVAFSRSVSNVALPAAFTNCATARIRFDDYPDTGPAR